MLKYTSNGCMVMEVDWGGNPKLNYTSYGCMLMKVDWGGKLMADFMIFWGTDKTQPNGHNISEVHWGGHGSNSNHGQSFTKTIDRASGYVNTDEVFNLKMLQSLFMLVNLKQKNQKKPELKWKMMNQLLQEQEAKLNQMNQLQLEPH